MAQRTSCFWRWERRVKSRSVCWGLERSYGQRRGDESKVHEKTHLVDLDALILGDDTGSRARSVEQHPIESTDNLGELPSIQVGNDDVSASQPGDVSSETLDTTPRGIVGPDLSGVAHESRHVGRLSSRGGGHVEYALVGLGTEGDDGEEGGGGLEDVVAGEVFGGGTCSSIGNQRKLNRTTERRENSPTGTPPPEKTCSPTLLHPPSSGSRLTPRLMRA